MSESLTWPRLHSIQTFSSGGLLTNVAPRLLTGPPKATNSSQAATMAPASWAIRYGATRRLGNTPATRKPGRDYRIEMAAADVAECRDEDEDGQPVREGNRRIMIDPEHCRAGSDKDKREGANELGHQGPL
jgi:hypothetical protein